MLFKKEVASSMAWELKLWKRAFEEDKCFET